MTHPAGMQLLSEKSQSIVHAVRSLGTLQLNGVPVFTSTQPVPGFPYVQERIYSWQEWKDTPWGKAKVVVGGAGPLSELTPFLFLQGQELPVTPPRLGFAAWDLATGAVSVHVWNEDEPVYYTQREADDNTYVIHTSIICELAEKRIPVYPEKLYGFFSRPFPYPLDKFRGVRIPYVSNDQVRCPVVGFATCQNNLVYLHTVGHKSALTSLRATVYQRKRLTIGNGADSWWPSTSNTYRAFLDPVPGGLDVHRMILVDVRALETNVTGTAFLLLPASATDVGQAFAARLDGLIPVPILPEWGETLLREGARKNLVQKLVAAYGDVQGFAIQVDAKAWADLVGSLLRDRLITM